jgi:hypothetical protein
MLDSNITSARGTLHCRKTRIPCGDQLVICGLYVCQHKSTHVYACSCHSPEAHTTRHNANYWERHLVPPLTHTAVPPLRCRPHTAQSQTSAPEEEWCFASRPWRLSQLGSRGPLHREGHASQQHTPRWTLSMLRSRNAASKLVSLALHNQQHKLACPDISIDTSLF